MTMGWGQKAQALLQDLGYAAKWVKSGNEALALEDEFAFDLIFSDVMMPGINGVELAERISERYPGLPGLLTGGYSTVRTESTHRTYKEALFNRSARGALRKITSAGAT
jgi:CheY-like chemotaxis protein